MGRRGRGWGLCAALLLSSLALAQPSSELPTPVLPMGLGELSFRFQNPASNQVTSLLVREDLSFGVGVEDRLQSITGVRVNLPFSLGAGWTLVTRTDLPIILAADPTNSAVTYYGLGDTDFAGLFSPSLHGPLWAGAALRIPTATSDKLGSGKLSVGPSVALVFQPRPWTVGAIAEQVWSIVGNEERPAVSRLRIQPVLAYALPEAWFLTSSPELVANWKAAGGQKWLVPVGAGFGKLFLIGTIPFDVQLEGFYNVVHPDLGPTWSLRAQFGLVEGR